MQRKMFVVAGSYAEFRDFTVKKEREYSNQNNVPQFVYVDSPEKLRGYREVHGWFIGSWATRSNIEDIKSTIATINSRTTPSQPITMTHTPTGTRISGVLVDEIEEWKWKSTAPKWDPPMYNNSST